MKKKKIIRNILTKDNRNDSCQKFNNNLKISNSILVTEAKGDRVNNINNNETIEKKLSKII